MINRAVLERCIAKKQWGHIAAMTGTSVDKAQRVYGCGVLKSDVDPVAPKSPSKRLHRPLDKSSPPPTPSMITPKVHDLTGQKFHRLEAIYFVGINTHRQAMWVCRCECGAEKVLAAKGLKSGNTKS